MVGIPDLLFVILCNTCAAQETLRTGVCPKIIGVCPGFARGLPRGLPIKHTIAIKLDRATAPSKGMALRAAYGRAQSDTLGLRSHSTCHGTRASKEIAFPAIEGFDIASQLQKPSCWNQFASAEPFESKAGFRASLIQGGRKLTFDLLSAQCVGCCTPCQPSFFAPSRPCGIQDAISEPSIARNAICLHARLGMYHASAVQSYGFARGRRPRAKPYLWKERSCNQA